MQTNISARHGHLSSSTQERITEKVEKLNRYFDRLTAIQGETTPLDPSDVYLIDYYLSVAPRFPRLDLDRVN